MRVSRASIRNGSAIIALAGLAGASLPPNPGLAAPDKPGTKPVTYHGVRLAVPTSWPVIDLTKRPGTCARVDRHAVYLGTPDAASSCPPGIAGRTETISLRPIGAAGPDTRVLHSGLPRVLPTTVDHSANWGLESAGVTMTVTYGTRPGALTPILSSARLSRTARPEAVPAAPKTPEAARAVPGRFGGYGFDACQAPSSATMDTWRSASDHRGVGVYIGGGDLGCPDQPNLSASWVSRQAGKGWHIFPLYVGRQAPCSSESFRITSAKKQGGQDAADAARKAAGYGMARGTIIISDMEYYQRGGSCSAAVVTYLAAWAAGLASRGYRSGVYSSRSAAIDDLVAARRAGRSGLPGTIDFAEWDNHARTTEPNIPSSYWVHHRIKQYRGAHNATHGGKTLNIDTDWMDIS